MKKLLWTTMVLLLSIGGCADPGGDTHRSTDAFEWPGASDPTPTQRVRDIDLGYDVPEVTGSFSPSESFAAVLGSGEHLLPATREDAYHGGSKTYLLSLDLDWDGDQDLMFQGTFADSDSGSDNAVIWNNGDGTYQLERFNFPRHGEDGADQLWFSAGSCYTAVDLVGDAANDLVCDAYSPKVVIIEGELRDGESGILWDRIHVLEQQSFDSEYDSEGRLVEEGIVEFRESEKYPSHNQSEFRYAGIHQFLAVDVDANGLSDLVVSTFAFGSSDFVYLQQEPGVWDRRILHYGQSFGAAPMWIDHLDQWCLHFMTEGGNYEKDWNENTILCYNQESDSFDRLYPEFREREDPFGYHGPVPEQDPYYATPMGCGTWQVMPDEPAYRSCSQNTPDFPIFEWVGTELVQLRESLPGVNPVGITSEETDDRWRVMWSQATTSLRGVAGVQDFVSASTGGMPSLGNNGGGGWVDPAPGYSAVQVLVRERDRFVDVGVESFPEGAWEGLQVTDQNNDGLPDILPGGVGRMPAIYENELHQVGTILHVMPRGCDHGCKIEVDYHVDRTYSQPVTSTGNPKVMGPPEVFIGLGDATEATIRLYRGVNDPVQEATIPLNGKTWFFDPDTPPYQRGE